MIFLLQCNVLLGNIVSWYHVDATWHSTHPDIVADQARPLTAKALPDGSDTLSRIMLPATPQKMLRNGQGYLAKSSGLSLQICLMPVRLSIYRLFQNKPDPWRPLCGSDWFWPGEAWKQDVWCCPVVSGTTLACDLFHDFLLILDLTGILGNCGQSKRCYTPLVIPKQFLQWGRTLCPSRGLYHRGVPLPMGNVLGLRQCLAGWYVSSGNHMNARTQGFWMLHCN